MKFGEVLHQSASTLIRRATGPAGEKLVIKQPADPSQESWQSARYQREAELTPKTQLVFLQRQPLQLIFSDFPGRPLETILQNRRLTFSEALEILQGGLSQLDYLHNLGYWHGLVHPQHLLWHPASGEVRLLDRARARRPGAVESEPFQRPRALWPFLAPEQAGQLARGGDQRSDYYALGACVYLGLTGVPIFPVRVEPVEFLRSALAQIPIGIENFCPEIPPALAQLVMRLLSKDPERRYQTNRGLSCDILGLQSRSIAPTVLGLADQPQSFRPPARLFGRDKELSLLSNLFNQASAGARSCHWIHGPQGTGKSALVEQLGPMVLQNGGVWAKTSFLGPDQESQAVLVELLRQSLEQLYWRGESFQEQFIHQIQASLGPNFDALSRILPQLSLSEKTDSPPDLLEGRREGQLEEESHLGQPHQRMRFALVQLAIEIGRAAAPLILWFDDSHLASRESLQLLEFLTAEQNLESILILISGRHPPAPHWPIPSTRLTELTSQDIQTLLEACRVRPSLSDSLSQVYQSRGGAIPGQLMRLLQATDFSWDGSNWSCNVDALISRLTHQDQPKEFDLGQDISRVCAGHLEWAACIGPQFELSLLAKLRDLPELELLTQLESALQTGLLRELAFSSTRQTQLVFPDKSLAQVLQGQMTSSQKSLVHHRIASIYEADPLKQRLALAHRCRSLDQIEQTTELVAVAEKVAQTSRHLLTLFLFEEAFQLLHPIHGALSPKGWTSAYQLMSEISGLLARCCWVLNDQQILNPLLEEIKLQARNLRDQIPYWTLSLRQKISQGDWKEAYQHSDDFLRLTGRQQYYEVQLSSLVWSATKTFALLRGRGPEQVRHLPRTTDPLICAIQEVQTLAVAAQVRYRPQTIPLGILRDVRSVLTDGLTPDGAQCWSGYGILCCHLGRAQKGLEWARLSMAQAEDLGRPDVWPRVAVIAYMMVGPWSLPLSENAERLKEVHQRALAVGDPWSGFMAQLISVWFQFFSGSPLDHLSVQVQRALHEQKQHGAASGQSELSLLSRVIARLRGDHGPPLSNDRLEDPLGQALECLSSLLLSLVFCEIDQAIQIFTSSQEPDPASSIVIYLYWHYGLVALWQGCALGLVATPVARQHDRRGRKIVENWTRHHGHWRRNWLNGLRYWALGQDPLPELEIALEGARRFGHLGDAALICQQTAEIYRRRGRPQAHKICQAEALEFYSQWGATAKLKDLAPAPLEVTAINWAAQAIADEHELQPLLQRLLSISCQIGGAERGTLLLRQRGGWQLFSRDDAEILNLPGNGLPFTGPLPNFPAPVLERVYRAGKSLVIDDAQVGIYSGDPYVLQTQQKSILCLPLRRSASILGLLYLENRLQPGVFTEERVRVLQLLSSHMALSIENVRRLQQLQFQQSEIANQSLQNQEQLARAETLQTRKESLTAFLAIASHDLKTPLATIQMWAQAGQQPEQHQNILHACRRASSLISTYLDVAAVESGHQVQLHCEELMLDQLVENEIDFQLDSLPASQRPLIPLSWDLAPVVLQGDGDKLRQIVANLIGNALKHCPIGTPIHIGLRRSGDQSLLEVIDNGPGISVEAQKNLFQPFAGRSRSGTGVGLWICRLLAEAHGGRLILQSTKAGCHFTLTLPVTGKAD